VAPAVLSQLAIKPLRVGGTGETASISDVISFVFWTGSAPGNSACVTWGAAPTWKGDEPETLSSADELMFPPSAANPSVTPAIMIEVAMENGGRRIVSREKSANVSRAYLLHKKKKKTPSKSDTGPRTIFIKSDHAADSICSHLPAVYGFWGTIISSDRKLPREQFRWCYLHHGRSLCSYPVAGLL
jgi:hypothetical protein